MASRMLVAMVTVVTMVGLATVVSAAEGLAVYYAPPYTPSACFGRRSYGSLVAGVSDALWGRGAACGRKYRVSCIGPANDAPHPCKRNRFVIVQVVDYCSAGCTGDINLSQDAFGRIADLTAGKIKIRYDQVS